MPRPYVSDTIPIVEYENEREPSYYHYITTTKESSHQCEAAVEQLSDYQSLVQFSLLLCTTQQVLPIKKMKERNKDNAPSTPSRAIIFLQFKNQADAIIGLALANGSGSSSDIPAGLRVSFTETSVAAERAKCEASNVKPSMRMEVAANNQPL